MPSLRIIPRENPWPDLFGKETIHIGMEAQAIQVSCIQHGMKDGKSSVVMIRIDLPDGKIVIAECSLELFLYAGHVLEAKYGHR